MVKLIVMEVVILDGGFERILSREASQAEEYAVMDKLKVGIMGISAGAGASFLSGCPCPVPGKYGKTQSCRR